MYANDIVVFLTSEQKQLVISSYSKARWNKSVNYLDIRLLDSTEPQELFDVNFKPVVNSATQQLKFWSGLKLLDVAALML